MKKTVQALLIAATLAIPSATLVSAQSTASMGHSMLVGSLVNELNRLGVSTANINNLTLDQAVELSTVLNNTQEEDRLRRQRAEAILEDAGN